MTDTDNPPPLRTILVDDEPLAIERLEVICGEIPAIEVVNTACNGKDALEKIEHDRPDLVLLDMTMPEMDGMSLARKLAALEHRVAVIFVTAHDQFAVEAFDLDAVDYVLKPVARSRLERAIERALTRRSTPEQDSQWLQELWVPNRSELLRIEISKVRRIDAERDYVRLYVGDRTYLLLRTIAGLEKRLDPAQYIRIHRSTILRRDTIVGLRHDGLGVWSVELDDGEMLRIGRTYLPKVKAIAGR